MISFLCIILVVYYNYYLVINFLYVLAGLKLYPSHFQFPFFKEHPFTVGDIYKKVFN